MNLKAEMKLTEKGTHLSASNCDTSARTENTISVIFSGIYMQQTKIEDAELCIEIENICFKYVSQLMAKLFIYNVMHKLVCVK